MPQLQLSPPSLAPSPSWVQPSLVPPPSSWQLAWLRSWRHGQTWSWLGQQASPQQQREPRSVSYCDRFTSIYNRTYLLLRCGLLSDGCLLGSGGLLRGSRLLLSGLLLGGSCLLGCGSLLGSLLLGGSLLGGVLLALLLSGRLSSSRLRLLGQLGAAGRSYDWLILIVKTGTS